MNTEKLGKALIMVGEALLDDDRLPKRRHRERERLGKDWHQWPIWAQMELLKYLRSLDNKQVTTN